MSHVYFSRALPTAEQAATRATRWRSPLVWVPARALLARAVWECAPASGRRAALWTLVRRDPPGTLDSLCAGAGLRPAAVAAGSSLRRFAGARRAHGGGGGPAARVACERRLHVRRVRGAQRAARGRLCVGRVRANELRSLKAMGASWVSVTPFSYLPNPAAPELVSSADGGPDEESDEAVCEVAARAKALGLRVAEAPRVDARVERGSQILGVRLGDVLQSLRGAGAALGVARRARGRGWACRGARAVERDRARSGALARADRRRARRVLGHAHLQANWDEAPRLPFWDALDVIGVSFYAPLASSPTRDGAALRAGAKRALEPYRALSQKFGKPVMMGELGYAATANAPVKPWEETRESPDPETQRACYAAMSGRDGRAGLDRGRVLVEVVQRAGRRRRAAGRIVLAARKAGGERDAGGDEGLERESGEVMGRSPEERARHENV